MNERTMLVAWTIALVALLAACTPTTPLTLKVEPEGPLHFGTDIDELFLVVDKVGSGTLRWSIAASGGDDWLGVTPIDGAGRGVITLTADRTGLAPGTEHVAEITISSNGGDARRTVTVAVPSAEPGPRLPRVQDLTVTGFTVPVGTFEVAGIARATTVGSTGTLGLYELARQLKGGRVSTTLDRDGTAWDRDPTMWDRDATTWDRDPTTWDRDATTWDRDPTTWDRDATTWDRDPTMWDRDAATWDRDPTTWDRDATTWDRDPTMWDRDATPWERSADRALEVRSASIKLSPDFEARFVLSWLPVTEADAYRIWLEEGGGVRTLVGEATADALEYADDGYAVYTVAGAFDVGDVKTFSVQATGAGREDGSRSEPDRGVIMAPARLVSPEEGAAVSGQPFFVWEAHPDGTAYGVYVAKGARQNHVWHVVVGGDGTDVRYPGDDPHAAPSLPPAEYMWYIAARGPAINGKTGGIAVSVVRSFIVQVP